MLKASTAYESHDKASRGTAHWGPWNREGIARCKGLGGWIGYLYHTLLTSGWKTNKRTNKNPRKPPDSIHTPLAYLYRWIHSSTLPRTVALDIQYEMLWSDSCDRFWKGELEEERRVTLLEGTRSPELHLNLSNEPPNQQPVAPNVRVLTGLLSLLQRDRETSRRFPSPLCVI